MAFRAASFGVLLSLPVSLSAYDFSEAEAFLQTYCMHCHNAEKANGEVRLDLLEGDFTDHSFASVWVEVRNQVNLGEMPPFDEPLQPKGEEIDALSKWISAELREAERASLANEGRVLLRRMSRFEYANTLEDLLGIRFPKGEGPLDRLPPDGTAEGFDRVSAALLLDPSLMRAYYEVAREVADKAIVDGEPPFPTKTMRFEFEDAAEGNVSRAVLEQLGVKPVSGGLEMVQGTVRPYDLMRYSRETGVNPSPVPGFYRYTLRVAGAPGKDGTMPRVAVTQRHPRDTEQKILERTIDAEPGEPVEYTVTLSRDGEGGEIRVSVLSEAKLYRPMRPGEHFIRRNRDIGREGRHEEVIRMAGRRFAEGWGGGRNTPNPEAIDTTEFPHAYLDYLEVEGPLYEQWPPHFQTEYLGEDSATLSGREAQLERAREALQRFLPRAFRRPVRAGEVEPFVGIVASELDNGESFHEAMRVGLTGVLTSPKFLFLHEPSAESDIRALNDYELATRLSFFLWSSTPDEALYRLAAEGRLSEPEVLTAQVDRMLEDPKADRMVEGFARQWLETDTFLAFNPDRHLFKAYDRELGEAAVREPLEFFRLIMRRDMSLLNFIDSNFTVVNQRLAEHYGLEGVTGPEFRPVELPEDSPRGGLLGMAGVHLAGSDGLRTKPVTRAVYVREVLFNDPPDPPPPNAGEIEPNIRGEHLTVRERLIQHQQIESCAACHRRLDPYGLALENFNVIGQWRVREDGQDFGNRSNTPAIDASGRLPNGAAFGDFREFRDALLAQEDRFRRGLAEKLFTYALGRPVTPADERALDEAVARMSRENDSLRSLVHAVVASNAFQTK